MKKITFFFLILFSISSFAQIEINENIDDISNNQVPTGWMDSGTALASGASPSITCNGSTKALNYLFTSAGNQTITTTNYSGISNGTDLTISFSYNIFEQVSQFPPPSFESPDTSWGSLVLEYSTDGGSNWSNITTITNNTFNDPVTCNETGDIVINSSNLPNGGNFQARFVLTVNTINNFGLWVAIDNIAFNQVATTIPNCDAVLTSPMNGDSFVDTDVTLNWSAATGLPTGYIISVGTTSGGTDIVNADTTTDTSYSLSGLNFTTQYFVNIVPNNGIGSATGCIEESFTTRTPPIAGATCSSPHVINSLPYFVSGGDTADYENNIDVSPCSDSYMRGNDVFYEISPAQDVSINIDITNIDNNGPSIHVVNGCPDSATECIAYDGQYNSGGSLSLQEVVLLAGNTYFIVLSNSSSTRTYTYDLIITQNSCINPEFTLSPVSDCGSGQFSVDVNITYMGDATSLTLVDDLGNIDNNITSNGVVNLGPYVSGSTVNFTLTNNQNSSCFFENSTYFYCPPANDECANSIALTVNTDGTCSNVLAATNAGATVSVSDPLTCGNNTNDVWYSFVAASETMVLEYLNVTEAIGSGGIFQATELLEGSCGSLISLSCSTGDNYVTFSDLTIGNTYYVRNSTNIGGEYAQNYDICIRTLPAGPANNDCSNAFILTASSDNTCNNAVAGTTIGATTSADNTCASSLFNYSDVWYVFNPTNTGYYEFALERLITTPATYYSIFSGSCGSLVEKSSSCFSNGNQIYFIDNSETYYIQVRSALNGLGIDFNLCVYQMPDGVVNSECSTPVTILESDDSNGNNAISGNINVTDTAYFSPEGCSGSSTESVWYNFTPQYTGVYNFNFTRVSGFASYTVYNTDDCSQTETAGFVTGLSSCYNSTTPRTGELVAGNTYLVMIHASSAAEYEFFVYPDPSLSVESSVIDTFKYYPNPVVNILTVEAKDAISKITIHNIVGQQVKVISPNRSKTTINMDAMKNGVYFVTVSINDAQKTIRVIKN